eukprot:TRINITY_DN1999_c0_g1_i1.p1 TRINITY_DN1999_c0_g1~~TRINITY_DN1999_c0_g1_i1.p1  ORF type:complete len:210 (+),score=34.40 TRINITY_DN1999_c0_g1_i1:97-726(+)
MISGEDSGDDAVVPRTRRFTLVVLLMAIVAFVGIVGFAARSQGTLVGQETIEKDALIYQDLFTGKVILTDKYKMKLVDDFYFEVEAKYVVRSPEAPGFDVIIDQENVEEYNEEPNFKKFLGVMKKIIAKVRTKMDKERHTVFKQKLNLFFKNGPGNKDKFKNFQIFFSKDEIDLETGDLLAAPIFLDADDTGMQAKIYYFKDLMEEIKA